MIENLIVNVLEEIRELRALHSVRNLFHSTVYDCDMIYSATLTLDESNQVQHVVEFPGADPDSQISAMRGYRTRSGNTRSNRVYIDCALFIIQSETTHSQSRSTDPAM
jgi:hypothetical protein